MSPSTEPTEATKRLLDGYLPERTVAEERGIVLRTLRAERQRGDGPPYVKITKKIFYPEAGFREWLKAIEQHSVRNKRRA